MTLRFELDKGTYDAAGYGLGQLSQIGVEGSDWDVDINTKGAYLGQLAFDWTRLISFGIMGLFKLFDHQFNSKIVPQLNRVYARRVARIIVKVKTNDGSTPAELLPAYSYLRSKDTRIYSIFSNNIHI